MPVGWFKGLCVERTAIIVINETIHNIDRTLQDNPDLTMVEALKLIDKKRRIFFPGEPDHSEDLKSLFTMIVWKAYRYKRFSDPMAASPEHRDLIFKTVQNYLNRENLTEAKSSRNSKSDEKFRFIKTTGRAALALGAVIIMVSALLISINPGILQGFNHSDKENTLVAQNDIFNYSGYIATDHDVSALVNKTIYHVGDLLGENEKYIIKSIHPKHIVIQNKTDKSEFYVKLKNK